MAGYKKYEHAPGRGNWLLAQIGRFILWCMGFRIVGEVPDIPHAIVVGAPHTSNWDGMLMVGIMLSRGIRLSFMIKDSAVQGTFGKLLLWLGAVPIDRTKTNAVVDSMIEQLQRPEGLFLCIGPEGTRKGPDKWKTGFYHIARQADVPILPVRFDYGRGELLLDEPRKVGDDLSAEMARLYEFYKDIVPRRPQRLSGPLRRLNAGEDPEAYETIK